MRRSQALVALLLTATFAAGLAGGVAADRLWLRPPPAEADDGKRSGAEYDGNRRGEERDRKEGADHEDGDDEDTVIERFSEELGLSSRQETRIDTILEHYRESMKELRRQVRPRYDALVDSARRRIEGVLDSAQARKYRQLLERKGKWDDRGKEDGRRDDGRGERE